MYTNMNMCLFITLSLFVAFGGASPVWTSEPLKKCPSLPAEKDLSLDEVAGDWRVAYIFLGQVDQGLDEDNTCVVASFTPTNDSAMELSLFIDSIRDNHIDRSTIQLPADIISPGEWRVHAPLTHDGFLHARIIMASSEHLLVTFCSTTEKKEISNKMDGASAEETIDWGSIFESNYRRKKRSYAELEPEESHLWTAVLVKHNNISALKFVEYAAILMKHGYDVAQGELVSFGKCPITKPVTVYSKKSQNSVYEY